MRTPLRIMFGCSGMAYRVVVMDHAHAMSSNLFTGCLYGILNRPPTISSDYTKSSWWIPLPTLKQHSLPDIGR